MTKVSCPACSARYNVPEEKLGKRVKCAKCGERFELAAPPEDDGFPDLLGLETGQTVVSIPLSPPPDAAPGGAAVGPGRRGERADAIGAGAISAYLVDVFGFFKIIAQPWELATLVAVCGICLLQLLAAFAGCLGLAAKIIITGWYLSFLLKTVQSGAARDEGLPDFSLADGAWEGIIVPCLSFLSVRLIVITPLIFALGFAMNNGGLDSGIAYMIGFLGVAMPEMALLISLQSAEEFPVLLTFVVPALLLGLAAAPMLVLVVAIGGIPALSRLDLMAQTIARTLPGYAMATIIYVGSLGLAMGVAYAAEEAVSDGAAAASPSAPAAAGSADPNAVQDPNMPVGASPSPRAAERQFMGSLGGQAVATLVSVLASIFSMRAIGLYYAHFKRNFAWSWG